MQANTGSTWHYSRNDITMPVQYSISSSIVPLFTNMILQLYTCKILYISPDIDKGRESK